MLNFVSVMESNSCRCETCRNVCNGSILYDSLPVCLECATSFQGESGFEITPYVEWVEWCAALLVECAHEIQWTGYTLTVEILMNLTGFNFEQVSAALIASENLITKTVQGEVWDIFEFV